MSGLLWPLMQWPSSALSLLLLTVVGWQTGVDVVQAGVCSLWGAPNNRSLSQDGDVIIGGIFNLYYIPSPLEEDFIKLPHYGPCSGYSHTLCCYYKMSGGYYIIHIMTVYYMLFLT